MQFYPSQGASWIDQRVGNRGSKRQWPSERLCSIRELSHPARTSCSCQGQANIEAGRHDMLPLSAPHGPIKGLQNKVDYGHWPGANAQTAQCRAHSALRVWAGNCAPVTVIAHTELSSFPNHRKGRKWSPGPLSLRDPGRPAKPDWQV